MLIAPAGPPSASCPAYTQSQTAPTAAVAASNTTGLLHAELGTLMVDCFRSGWDGHGAKAVGQHEYRAALRFIESLPPGFPPPTISADPDGCITFEWRVGARRMVLLSVHPDNRVDYAAVFGSSKTYGCEPFFGELPKVVSELVRRTCAA